MNAMMTGGRLVGALILIAVQSHPSALQWSYLYFGATAAVALVTSILYA